MSLVAVFCRPEPEPCPRCMLDSFCYLLGGLCEVSARELSTFLLLPKKSQILFYSYLFIYLILPLLFFTLFHSESNDINVDDELYEMNDED